MGELISVAKDMASEATELVSDIDSFKGPPSRTQLETVQEALDRLQRKLNRIQGEADAWGEEQDRRVAHFDASPINSNDRATPARH